jgi:segregation and condensation protein B
MNLETKLEAILFWKGEPVTLKKLVEIFKVSEEEILSAVSNLEKSLEGRGIVLLKNNEEFSLGTSPELSNMIEDLTKEELNKDLSKAALETLSILLYKNGASRSEIDYIRGVNSSFTLRALSIRGLVDKVADTKDSRRYIYKPSFELLSFMGVKSVEELPDYEQVLSGINVAINNLEEESKEDVRENTKSN